MDHRTRIPSQSGPLTIRHTRQPHGPSRRLVADWGPHGFTKLQAQRQAPAADPRSRAVPPAAHPARRVCHWLFLKGGMSVVLLGGVMLAAIVAGLLGIR